MQAVLSAQYMSIRHGLPSYDIKMNTISPCSRVITISFEKHIINKQSLILMASS